MCYVGFANSELSLALTMRYPKKQLPCLTNWQHFGSGEYVCALEPGTNPPIVQNKAREQKKLIISKPSETSTYQLELAISNFIESN
jgi:hypothetical protein